MQLINDESFICGILKLSFCSQDIMLRHLLSLAVSQLKVTRKIIYFLKWVRNKITFLITDHQGK
jgi:hypothetical protein